MLSYHTNIPPPLLHHKFQTTRAVRSRVRIHPQQIQQLRALLDGIHLIPCLRKTKHLPLSFLMRTRADDHRGPHHDRAERCQRQRIEQWKSYLDVDIDFRGEADVVL